MKNFGKYSHLTMYSYFTFFIILVRMCVYKIYLVIFLVSLVDSLIKGPRTLVLLENQHQVASFSILFGHLSQHNFELTFRLSDDSSLALSQYGEYLYENIFIMAPTTEEFGGELSSISIIDFIDSGRNVFICINSRGELLFENVLTLAIQSQSCSLIH